MRIQRDVPRVVALAIAARLLPVARRSSSAPRRLLLIRPDHLGDLLLTGPAISALRQSLPTAELTLLVGPWSAEVARRGPMVDQLLTCPFPGFTRARRRHPLEPYRLLVRLAQELRGRFDLAVVLRPDHWWGALLARLAAVSLRLGYDTPTTRSLLTEALPWPPREHSARLSLRLARRAIELGGGNPPQGDPPPIFRLHAEERAWAARLLEGDPRPLALIHPGAGAPLKQWPPERWAAVGDALAERDGRLVISGGADDLATPRAVAAALRHPALQLAGQTSLGQLGALCERARLALGTDNGPLHLAAALGTPTFRLYGPTDERIFGPLDRAGIVDPGPGWSHRLLTHQLPCRPCGNLQRPPCGARTEPACLFGLETEQVVAAALAHWDASATRPA